MADTVVVQVGNLIDVIDVGYAPAMPTISLLGGDIAGTDADPQVVSTHLSSPLPLNQGGTGASTSAGALAAIGGAASLVMTAVKTSAYSAAPLDYVRADATTGSLTVTLPNAPAAGTTIGVKMTGTSGTNTVTVACAGSDVFNKTGGGTTFTLSTLNQGAVFQYGAGAIWLIASSDFALSSLDGRYPPIATTPQTGAGLTFDGVTNNAAALNADQAASRTLLLPAGTGAVTATVTWNDSQVKIQGTGMYATTILSSGGLASIFSQFATGTGFVSEIEISDLTINCNGVSAAVAIEAYGTTIDRLTIRRVRFINCPANMIAAGYASNYVIEDCIADGAGQAEGTFFVGTTQTIESLIIRRNKLRWLRQGIVVGAGSGTHQAYIEISDNDIDLGWWLIAASAFTGSGGTVTYTSTGLTDTAAAFSGIAANTTVRAMPVRGTGTFTTGTTGATLIDTSATYVSWGVKRGEIVRSGTSFAVVSEVISNTTMHVEEWLSQTTYQPVAPPGNGGTYTVYGIYLGNITASTGTTLTVQQGAGHGLGGWYDLAGAAQTPASGTLYEVLVTAPVYPVFCNTTSEKVQIINNRLRRGWADQIECFGSRAIITGNIVEDGQDEGIVYQGTAGGIVSGNICKHNGVSGLMVLGSSANVEVGPNLYQDNGWSIAASASAAQFQVDSSTRVTVTGGRAYNTGESTPQIGLELSGSTSSGIKVIGFSGAGNAVADIYVASSLTAGASQILDCTGVLAYQVSTNGQFLRMSGTGAPAIAASPGSVYMRTDGAGGTTEYVKETGNGTTGWTAFSTGAGSFVPSVSVVTATNATWPVPSGANWLEITAVGGGGQGGGGGSLATSTLTTGLTSGVAVTSLAFTANPQAWVSGATITVVSGANTQTFTTTAAGAVSATSVTVTSLNANFSYPIGSTINVSSWGQTGGGGGAAGGASTEVVAVGANTTLNVTIGAGGSAAGGGGANTGAAGTGGSNGVSTTVTGTGIAVTGGGGMAGAGSAVNSTAGGAGGSYGGTQTVTSNTGPGQGAYQGAGGGPNGYAAGGGGSGGTASYANGGRAGGAAGTAIAGGAAGSGAGLVTPGGGTGGSAAANTGGGGGAGGGAYCGGVGGTGGAGGSGFAVIRVVS